MDASKSLFIHNPNITLHLILYANGEVFENTKNKLVSTLKSHTSCKNIKIHVFNHTILINNYSDYKNSTKLLSSLEREKNIPSRNLKGRRDGYYNYFKPYIINLVLQKANYNDILYYCDCSKYFKTGFTENIDNLVNICNIKTIIAGCTTNEFTNKTPEICDYQKVIHKIYKIKNFKEDINIFLNKAHINASIILLTKTKIIQQFITDWLYFCIYTDESLIYPLITYHHTVDQSIFNILVHIYKFPLFINTNYHEYQLRDRNRLAKIIRLEDVNILK